jgi:pyruvate dehydrogenase E2 component (dihydrolipoamide acetyltransferase)
MSKIVRLPEVLTGMSEAALVSWHVSPGDQVRVGQPLADVETEKAVVECEAEESGTVAGFLVEIGQPITAGTPIVVLADAGESLQQAMSQAAGPASRSAAASVPAPTEASEDGQPAAVSAEANLASNGVAPTAERPGGRRFASPLVRRLARERGLDLSGIAGTGPGGRIVRRDLDHPDGPAASPSTAPSPAPSPATASPPAAPQPPAGYTDIPHTGMRRAIARRLTESQSTVPHFYLAADCRVDALLELRRSVNEQTGANVSVNDFVVKAVAGAMTDIPDANVIWTPDATRRFSSVSIGVAVAVDGGLVTPVVRDVDQRSLTDISRTIADLARRAREGRLRQPELEGGSFAVSNLGMYGTERFTAIINPPHAGILAVGAAAKRPVVDDDGALGVATVMTVTLSGDHRVFDGALAAQWLDALKKRLESPLSILI